MKNGKPDTDSVGGRTLGYIWYRDTATDDFKNLNLELVENGYAENKCTAGTAYYDYFKKAENFARSIELRLFSKLDDPLFNKDVREFSIKDFWANTSDYAELDKVGLHAFVYDISLSSNGAITWILGELDENNVLHTMNLYVGYQGSGTRLVVGNSYYIVANLQKYNSSWQLAGIEFDDADKSGEKTVTEKEGYYLSFNDEVETNYRNFYSNLTVESVNVTDTEIIVTGSATKHTYSGNGGTAQFTVSIAKPANYNNAIAVGKQLVFKGFQFEEGKITVFDYSNVTVK